MMNLMNLSQTQADSDVCVMTNNGYIAALCDTLSCTTDLNDSYSSITRY